MPLQSRPAGTDLRHHVRDEDVGDQVVSLGVGVRGVEVECGARLFGSLEVRVV